MGATVDVTGLIYRLFSSGWQYKFSHVAMLWGQSVENYSSVHAAGAPYAEVYVNSDAIVRMVFHGFDTPGHFATYHCAESVEAVRY